jgi:CspA family cold shock protein
VTCTCEGAEADCKSTIAKPSALKGSSGTVKFFNTAKGYGFIANEADGRDYFVHISALQKAGLSSLEPNQRIEFDVESDRLGRVTAVNIRVTG